MPCHADRVRRNYHRLTLIEREDPAQLRTRVEIVIDRDEIATAMSAREVKRLVMRHVSEGIDRAYGQI